MPQMRAQGNDPRHTSKARKRRTSTNTQQRRASEAWKEDGSLNGVDFARDILPRIQGVPVRALAATMNVGVCHASNVRSGRAKPHKRHWKALMDLKR